MKLTGEFEPGLAMLQCPKAATPLPELMMIGSQGFDVVL